jgi:hypothetical protein
MVNAVPVQGALSLIKTIKAQQSDQRWYIFYSRAGDVLIDVCNTNLSIVKKGITSIIKYQCRGPLLLYL